MEDSRHAPAERLGIETIHKQFHFLKKTDYVQKLIDSLPYIGAILNDHRQVVFANDYLLEILKLETIQDILGQRPGEVIHCINSQNEIGGCGTSENCTVCGAVNCILEAQRTNRKTVSECRINAEQGKEIVAFDFKITTTPFFWEKQLFYVFSMVDISNEKRRKAMERIFFHDVINKTGSMHGFIDLLKGEDDLEKVHQFIDFLDTINQDLTAEIVFQRDLTAAEHGELIVELSDHSSLDIIRVCAKQIAQHEVAKKKMILEDQEAGIFSIHTDGTILRRILMNMLKNALEATNAGGAVRIGCSEDQGKKKFWVHNDILIPRESQLQIFQRSFSTKGASRGLGTYSMKLLGEQYLQAEVGFESTEENGTIFFIEFQS